MEQDQILFNRAGREHREIPYSKSAREAQASKQSQLSLEALSSSCACYRIPPFPMAVLSRPNDNLSQSPQGSQRTYSLESTCQLVQEKQTSPSIPIRACPFSRSALPLSQAFAFGLRRCLRFQAAYGLDSLLLNSGILNGCLEQGSRDASIGY